MKKTLLLLTAATLLSGCRPTGFRYTLTGHIEGLNDSVALVESVTKDTLAVLPAPDGLQGALRRTDGSRPRA